MLRLAADENFNNTILRGVTRRLPAADIVRVQDVGLSGADDPAFDSEGLRNHFIQAQALATLLGSCEYGLRHPLTHLGEHPFGHSPITRGSSGVLRSQKQPAAPQLRLPEPDQGLPEVHQGFQDVDGVPARPGRGETALERIGRLVLVF